MSIKNSVTKLNDTNYETWRIAMRALLRYLGLWGFITGTKTVAAYSGTSAAADYRLDLEKAASSIILHLDDVQTRLVGDEDDPKTIWELLESTHRAAGFGSRYHLRRGWLNLMMGEGEAMTNWIASVESYRRQLEGAGAKIDDEEVIIVLVNGLPESFENFRVTLDSVPTKDLTLAYVKKRLVNEAVRVSGPTDAVSVRVKLEEVTENGPTAMAARGRTVRVPERRRIIVGGSTSTIECHRCGELGHVAKDCRAILEGDTRAGRASAAYEVDRDGDDNGAGGVWAF